MANLILGVDPGSLRTGFGLVKVEGEDLSVVEFGVIEAPSSWTLEKRLLKMCNDLETLYRRVGPAVTVIEKIFFGKNADSAFKLGHARGVCLLAAARFESPVHEYAARFVKKCVTGSGAATKDHVQMVILSLLRLPNKPMLFDATDALALAVTHSREAGNAARIEAAMKRAKEMNP